MTGIWATVSVVDTVINATVDDTHQPQQPSSSMNSDNNNSTTSTGRRNSNTAVKVVGNINDSENEISVPSENELANSLHFAMVKVHFTLIQAPYKGENDVSVKNLGALLQS